MNLLSAILKTFLIGLAILFLIIAIVLLTFATPIGQMVWGIFAWGWIVTGLHFQDLVTPLLFIVTLVAPLLILILLLTLIAKKDSRMIILWICVAGVTVGTRFLFLFLPIAVIYTHWRNDPIIKMLAFIVLCLAFSFITPVAPILLAFITAIYIHWQDRS